MGRLPADPPGLRVLAGADQPVARPAGLSAPGRWMAFGKAGTVTADLRCDVAVIGGGLVGAATALALAERDGLVVAVLETEDRLAAHQSGHNSGVIHSGL